jgi:hypothetical protein
MNLRGDFRFSAQNPCVIRPGRNTPVSQRMNNDVRNTLYYGDNLEIMREQRRFGKINA